MQKFIHQKNLEHFRKLLTQTQDTAERERLLNLLAEEEAKELPPKPSNDHPSSRNQSR